VIGFEENDSIDDAPQQDEDEKELPHLGAIHHIEQLINHFQ
jgi:hypothetical protein